jgi:starvation-inducible DNA-binding protein
MKNSKAIVEKLNILLSNTMVYYQNLRGYHWNIQGPAFFELHEKFEELYLETAEFADEVAERILQLDGKPLHTYTDFLKTSQIKEESDVYKDVDCVKNIVSHSETNSTLINEILDMANEADDEGTANLMSDQINVIEKRLWMFKAYLA